MFERYAEKARRAIFFARYEASNSGASAVEAEHLLLGAMREGGFGPTILNAMRTGIQKVSPPGAPLPASVDLPVSHAAKRAMAFAAEEATALGHQHIGIEHLLLGLMRDDRDSTVPGLLKKHGIDREKVLSRLSGVPADTPVDRGSLKALVDTLPAETLQGVKQTLEMLGRELDELRFEVTPAAPRVTPIPSNSMHAVKRALAFAAEEAERLGHRHVGEEHLLLGLMRAQGDSVVAGLLKKHGIDREEVVRAIADRSAELPVDRDSLKGLIDSLPEERLRGAKQMLEHLSVPRPLPQFPPSGFQGGWLGGGGGFFGSWNFRGIPRGPMRQGRHSRSRMEDGVEVVETRHVRDGCEITLVERFRLSEDGKTLSYTQEIAGPGKTEQHTIDFEVSREGGKNSGGSNVR